LEKKRANKIEPSGNPCYKCLHRIDLWCRVGADYNERTCFGLDFLADAGPITGALLSLRGTKTKMNSPKSKYSLCHFEGDT